MALLGANASRYGTNACRSFTGNLAILAGGGVGGRRQNFDQTGSHRNWTAGWHTVTDVTRKSGLPNGYLPPYSWMMPQEGGAMTTRRGVPVISLEGVAEGALGLNGVADATITINATATGGLIAGGVASATITLSGTAEAFAAISGVANATITVGGTAEAGGLAFPTATGTISLDGNVVSYAIGHMVATTDFGNEFSASNLARAIWDARAADYNASGTMGEKLNAAGTAGDPWTATGSDYTTPGQMGYIINSVIQKILRNKTVTDPSNGTMTVYDDDGVTPLFTCEVFEDVDGIQDYRGQGADRRDRLT